MYLILLHGSVYNIFSPPPFEEIAARDAKYNLRINVGKNKIAEHSIIRLLNYCTR